MVWGSYSGEEPSQPQNFSSKVPPPPPIKHHLTMQTVPVPRIPSYFSVGLNVDTNNGNVATQSRLRHIRHARQKTRQNFFIYFTLRVPRMIDKQDGLSFQHVVISQKIWRIPLIDKKEIWDIDIMRTKPNNRVLNDTLRDNGNTRQGQQTVKPPMKYDAHLVASIYSLMYSHTVDRDGRGITRTVIRLLPIAVHREKKRCSRWNPRTYFW